MPVVPTTTPILRRATLWLFLLIVGAAAGVLAWRLDRSPGPASPLARFSIDLGGTTLTEGLNQNGSEIAVSRDGRRFVYPGDKGGTSLLYVREIDQLQSRALPGTEGGVNPFFSPDGEWVGFFAGPGTSSAKLKKISIRGGSPIMLCDAPVPVGGSWGNDDVIFFGPSADRLKNMPSMNSGWSLSRISAKGGSPQTVIVPDVKNAETRFAWPELLPGGKALLFSVAVGGNSFEESHIAVLSLDTGKIPHRDRTGPPREVFAQRPPCLHAERQSHGNPVRPGAPRHNGTAGADGRGYSQSNRERSGELWCVADGRAPLRDWIQLQFLTAWPGLGRSSRS